MPSENPQGVKGVLLNYISAGELRRIGPICQGKRELTLCVNKLFTHASLAQRWPALTQILPNATRQQHSNARCGA